jgi:hypothetical protein
LPIILSLLRLLFDDSSPSDEDDSQLPGVARFSFSPQLKCRRIENPILETVDFVTIDGDVCFRTCAAEHKQVVLQMGTADPQRALAAAKVALTL